MKDNLIFFQENSEENKVTIPAEFNKEVAENYAPQRQKNSRFYATRRGGSAPTVFDSWYYKCAEYAAAKFLNEKFNLPFVAPDTKIYTSRQRNWNCDLPYFNVKFLNKNFTELRVHCKSVTQKSIAKGYRESFMFQLANKEGSGGTDIIFKEGSEKDYCVLVHVPYSDIVEGDLKFYVRGVMPWNYIKDNGLLENPIKKELIGCKYCVYSESISKSLKKNLQKK